MLNGVGLVLGLCTIYRMHNRKTLNLWFEKMWRSCECEVFGARDVRHHWFNKTFSVSFRRHRHDTLWLHSPLVLNSFFFFLYIISLLCDSSTPIINIIFIGAATHINDKFCCYKRRLLAAMNESNRSCGVSYFMHTLAPVCLAIDRRTKPVHRVCGGAAHWTRTFHSY